MKGLHWASLRGPGSTAQVVHKQVVPGLQDGNVPPSFPDRVSPIGPPPCFPYYLLRAWHRLDCDTVLFLRIQVRANSQTSIGREAENGERDWDLTLRQTDFQKKTTVLQSQSTGKARFRRRTFHEPNLIPWIEYMKSSASVSIKNVCFSLERLSRSFPLAWPGISPLERVWNGFDSDAELFMHRTKRMNYYNVFCKQFDRDEHFSPFGLSSVAIKIGVWINSAGLNNLGRP